MPIIEDNSEYQLIYTETANGSTMQTVAKPGSRTANANEVFDQLTQSRTALTTAFNAMDTIANATGTLTTAQITTQLRQVASATRFALRLEGRLLRIAIGDFTGSD